MEGGAAVSISNCKLTGNEALGTPAGGGYGGAIEDMSSSSGTLTVTNSTFDDNKAIAVGPNDPIVSSSYIFAAGGAIDLNLNSTGQATISNSTFTGNEALGGSPGASAGGGALSSSFAHSGDVPRAARRVFLPRSVGRDVAALRRIFGRASVTRLD